MRKRGDLTMLGKTGWDRVVPGVAYAAAFECAEKLQPS